MTGHVDRCRSCHMSAASQVPLGLTVPSTERKFVVSMHTPGAYKSMLRPALLRFTFVEHHVGLPLEG